MTDLGTMTLATTSAAVVMASLLLAAGLGKLASLPAAASTVSALGVPARWAGRAAAVLALSEVATAFGVLFAPGSRWTLTGVAALAGTFALAGLIAALRKKAIRCHCLGAGPGTYLGWMQMLALPAWVGVALFLYHGARDDRSFATGALLLATAGLAIATLKVAALRQAVRDARGDRLSAQEMYIWLPPR